MRDIYKFQYTPAVHEGQVNRAGLVFDYLGVIVDHFRNTTEGETFSGVTVKIHDNQGPTGQTRRFRWDRIVKATNIINTAQAMHGGRI
jgi:hypothetical protein